MDVNGIECAICKSLVYAEDVLLQAKWNDHKNASDKDFQFLPAIKVCVACTPDERYNADPLSDSLRAEIVAILDNMDNPVEVPEEKPKTLTDEQAQYYADWEGFF